MTSHSSIQKFSDGDLCFWTVNGTSVHIKAATACGDPVELNSEELRELIVSLQNALSEIE